MIRITRYRYRYFDKKGNHETRKISSVPHRINLINGPFILIMKIVEDTVIKEMLKKHLADMESRCKRRSRFVQCL